ncbi:MAG: hypothetical protein HQK89_02510 [Nitrospirae bacterium]|nr:hypothetical protein [Nitrospirota bacterium]
MFILLCCVSICLPIDLNAASSDAASFTQADRDRMIRVEIKLDEGLKAVNQRIEDTNKRIEDIDRRFEDTNKRIEDINKRIEDTNRRFDDTNRRVDDLRGVMYVLIGSIFSGVFILISFVLWDRRTTLAPVARTTRELEERTNKLEHAIKEKAETDPGLKEALKHAGIQ